MSPLSETDWHRRQIGAFVKAQRINIRLQRPVMVDTPAGGKIKSVDDELRLQTFRLVPFKRRLTLEYGLSRNGEEVQNIQYVLVGAYDADVQLKDWFTLENTEYEVKFVSDLRLHRTAAGLIVRQER